MHRVKTHTGFTLIEMIIALFIFAIIAVIISYGLQNVFSAKQKISQVEQRLNQLQFALILVQHDVSQLVDYSSAETYGQSSTSGDNLQFKFTTSDNTNPLGLEQRSNLMQVDYLWTHNQFIRKIWLTSKENKPVDVSSRVLLPNITHFKFRYLTPSGFIDTWPPPNQYAMSPPLAVQISFTVPGWGHVSQLYRIRGATLGNF